MDAVNPYFRVNPKHSRPSLHGPHPEHGTKALHPTDSVHPTLSGYGKHRTKPPHSGRPGNLSHRMTCMKGRRRMRRIHCTHRMHRRQCRQRMHRVYARLRMQCDRPAHLTHCPDALRRTHAEHVPQRKHAAGAFPHLVTLWHSLAACGPCRASLLSVILHPEPRSAARSARAAARADRGDPPGRRILSAHADSELFFCGTERFPCHKKTRPENRDGRVPAPKSQTL